MDIDVNDNSPTSERLLSAIKLLLDAGAAEIAISSIPSIPAGEAFIGSIGGNTTKNRVNIPVSLTAYAIDEVIGVGGILNIPLSRVVGGTVQIMDMFFTDKENKKPGLEIYFFKQLPTGAYNDNNPLAFSDVDLTNCVGRVDLLESQWVTVGTKATAQLLGLNLTISNFTGSANIYAIARIKTVVTYTNAASLDMHIGVSRD